MNAEEFVRAFRNEKDALLATHLDPSSGSLVAAEIAALALTPEQRAAVRSILDGALTDAFYTVLLALDGAAALGDVQQPYRILDEQGAEVCSGDGTLEALAYDYFQGDRAT